MYDVQFFATTSADWVEAVELIAADTNLPLDVPDDATFALTIGGRCWDDFAITSEAGEITRPADNIIQWRFTASDFARYWPGGTHPVGLTMTTSGGTTQLLIGTLSVLDGIVR